MAKQSTAAGCEYHDSDYWAAAMKGQNFASEDRLDTAAFNSALWRGLCDGAEPQIRDGRDLGKDRHDRIQDIEPAACASMTD